MQNNEIFSNNEKGVIKKSERNSDEFFMCNKIL